MWKTIRVLKHQVGLLYRRGEFAGALQPGLSRVFGLPWTLTATILDTREPELVHDDLKTLRGDPELTARVEFVDLSDDERALVWLDGRLHAILGPGLRAFWKSQTLHVERLSTTEVRFEHASLDRILDHADAAALLREAVVPQAHIGRLSLNEQPAGSLAPGRYAFWKGLARLRIEVVDLREQTSEVTGQEILTGDNVSLRVNLTAAWRVVDPARLAETVGSPEAPVYRELQLALRAHIGGRTLEELLASKEEISDALRKLVEPRVRGIGIELVQVGIKDVILPGDMKALMNRVIEAEKQARANLILRREETAAMRSLLNTAKLVESNPTMLRLKELETAERIAESVDSIHISGGLDELIERLAPRRA